jgi:hypothetical protein
MSLYKRRADDVGLSTPINENAIGVAIDVADKVRRVVLACSMVKVNMPMQAMDFALKHGGNNRGAHTAGSPTMLEEGSTSVMAAEEEEEQGLWAEKVVYLKKREGKLI